MMQVTRYPMHGHSWPLIESPGQRQRYKITDLERLFAILSVFGSVILTHQAS